MPPLRYSINVTLDGCVDHRVGVVDEETLAYWARSLELADALLLGRVTYQMMEDAWRRPGSGLWPDWMQEADIEFAETIDRSKKYVVSNTLEKVDWNAELLSGDLIEAVTRLRRAPGRGLFVGGVTLPVTLANAGLIDEYEFLVHPVIAGHGPNLFAGLAEPLKLKLVGRKDFYSGVVALKYEPQQPAPVG